MSKLSHETGHRGRTPGATRFAVRVPNWLGDSVLALPAVRALVECSEDSAVLVLASTSSGEVFSRLPGAVTRVVVTPGGGLPHSLRTVLLGAQALRRHEPSVVFSLTRSFTSAAMCLIGGVRGRVGFSDSAGGLLYTSRVGVGGAAGQHLCDAYCELVESAGLTIASRVPRLAAAPGDLEAGQRLAITRGLGPGGYVCLFPGARYGPSKRWGADRFGLLGDIILDRLGLDVAILGGFEDRDACEAVRNAMKREAVNLGGGCNFRELVGVVALSAGVVANDSGGMHLAAALGVPVVGLFFSTDPHWTGPRGPGSVALYNKTECSPCFKRDCSLGAKCTESIAVDQALGALAGLLGRPV